MTTGTKDGATTVEPTRFPRIVWSDGQARVVQLSEKSVAIEMRDHDAMGEGRWAEVGREHWKDVSDAAG